MMSRETSAPATKKKVGRAPVTSNQAKIGKLKAPRMEETETNRLRARTTAKTPMAAKAAIGETTRKTPKPVATPLPPRNLSQTGNMWPRTAQRAANASAVRKGTEGIQSEASQAPSQTAAQPLRTSRIKVAAPRPLPPARSTLVAPMLPLPKER